MSPSLSCAYFAQCFITSATSSPLINFHSLCCRLGTLSRNASSFESSSPSMFFNISSGEIVSILQARVRKGLGSILRIRLLS